MTEGCRRGDVRDAGGMGVFEVLHVGSASQLPRSASRAYAR